MSWNTSRILNDLEYEINHDKQDVSLLKQKTIFISDQLSPNGTVFSGNIYCDGFVINGTTEANKGYLMSDGTVSTASISSSQQGQPNIYLYTNSNALPSNNPQSGQVRFNIGSITTVKHLFISVMTSDNININVFLSEINDVSIIYLQDKNSSTDWVRYTVQGITIYPAYVDINVTYLSSSGLGGGDFGESEPIFMSIFDNSSAISNRITSLETKTQHQSASSIETRFNSPINMYDHKIYNVSDPISLKDQ
jgi:hypothetical protein